MTADQGDPIPLGLPGQQNYSSLILGRAVIEGGARFVQQEHTGVELQGAKQPEKLALTTCEMTGVLVEKGVGSAQSIQPGLDAVRPPRTLRRAWKRKGSWWRSSPTIETRGAGRCATQATLDRH